MIRTEQAGINQIAHAPEDTEKTLLQLVGPYEVKMNNSKAACQFSAVFNREY